MDTGQRQRDPRAEKQLKLSWTWAPGAGISVGPGDDSAQPGMGTSPCWPPPGRRRGAGHRDEGRLEGLQGRGKDPCNMIESSPP